MKKIFDYLNPAFFNVLSCKNKQIYLDSLFIIYDEFKHLEGTFQLERSDIVHRLIQYFEDEASAVFAVDELPSEYTEEGENLTPRKKANITLNYLVKCGWIGEEDIGDYKRAISFFPYSISILEAIASFKFQIDDKENETEKDVEDFVFDEDIFAETEYTSDIYTIYTLLKNFEVEQGLPTINECYERTTRLVDKLKTLGANIYNYYYKLVNAKEEISVDEVLDQLLHDYKNNFFDKSYYLLKTTESIPKYKVYILKYLRDILTSDPIMEKLADQLVELKKRPEFTKEFAFQVLEHRIQAIRDYFTSLENLISEIDIRNERYIGATTAKFLYLTNRSDDIEGIFNRAFDLILNEPNREIDTTKIFNLIQARNLDHESLYKERVLRMEAKAAEMELDAEFPFEKYELVQASMLKQTDFGMTEIDKYVQFHLAGRPEMQAKTLPLGTEVEYVKLILIFLYSNSSQVNFRVELGEEKVDINGIRFKDFKIYKKR